jgi:polysaccharide biosynthesis transport protein
MSTDSTPAAAPATASKAACCTGATRCPLCIVALCLLSALAGAAATWLATRPRSVDTAKETVPSIPEDAPAVLLRVAPEQSRIIAAKGDTSGAFRRYGATQQQLIKSRPVIVAALKKAEIAELPSVRQHKDPAAWLVRDLRVDFPGNGEVMRLRLTAAKGEDTAKVLNAVVRAYLSEVVDGEQKERAIRLGELEKIIAQNDTELRELREKARQLAEAEGVAADPDVATYKSQLALSQLSQARNELVRVQNDLTRADAQLGMQKKFAETPANLEPSESEVDAFVQADPTTSQVLVPLVAQIRKQLLEAESRPGPSGSQSVEKLQENLKAVQAEIAARRAELRKGLPQRKRAALEAEIRGSEAQISGVKDLEKRCKENVEQLQAQANRYGGGNADLLAMAEQVRQLERLNSQLAEERGLLKVELKAPPRVRLIQEAEAP